MAFRVIKQLYPAPSSSADPVWATRKVYVASSSNMPLWEFSGSEAEASASAKAAELSGSDATGRTYEVIEV